MAWLVKEAESWAYVRLVNIIVTLHWIKHVDAATLVDALNEQGFFTWGLITPSKFYDS